MMRSRSRSRRRCAAPPLPVPFSSHTDFSPHPQQWYNGKSLAIFGSFYLIMNWVLTVSLLPRPWSTWNEVQLYGLGPVLSVPLIVLAALDWPRKHVWQWQSLVFASIWITAAANPIDMYVALAPFSNESQLTLLFRRYQCGFYTATPHCGNKDYMGQPLLLSFLFLSLPRPLRFSVAPSPSLPRLSPSVLFFATY